MKKQIFALALAIITIFATTPSVSAYSETSYMVGPETKNGVTTTSGITPMTSPTYTSVRGDRTYVYFNYLGTLRASSSVAMDDRLILVYSMEDDVEPNADEEVKLYSGFFTGRQLTRIVMSSVLTAGNIDSSGDPTAEFYILQHLEYVDGDVRGGENGPVYYYKFRVD